MRVNLDKPLLTTLNVITSTPGGTDILTLANSPLPSCVIVNFFSFFSTLVSFEGGVIQSTLKGADGRLITLDTLCTALVVVFNGVGGAVYKFLFILLNHVIGSATNSVILSSS